MISTAKSGNFLCVSKKRKAQIVEVNKLISLAYILCPRTLHSWSEKKKKIMFQVSTLPWFIISKS